MIYTGQVQTGIWIQMSNHKFLWTESCPYLHASVVPLVEDGPLLLEGHQLTLQVGLGTAARSGVQRGARGRARGRRLLGGRGRGPLVARLRRRRRVDVDEAEHGVLQCNAELTKEA